ncbi:unnamed protein product [Dicrocoelium dendriticum]|nr:unnamed protein product [Dicrocoelium dendriticum]
MDLGSHVPNDVNDTLQSAQNGTLLLESSNYTDAVSRLRKSPIDLESTNSFLDMLESDIKRTTFPPVGAINPQFQLALTTIDAVRKQLRNLDPILENANLLLQSIEKLQRQKLLSDHLRKLGDSLDTTVKTLADPKLLEAPILPAYKNATHNLLADLSSGLDNLTTEFTGAVVSCNRLHYVVHSMIKVSCSTTGLINRLGGTSFIFVLLFFPLLLATLTFQLFIILHGYMYSVSLK